MSTTLGHLEESISDMAKRHGDLYEHALTFAEPHQKNLARKAISLTTKLNDSDYIDSPDSLDTKIVKILLDDPDGEFKNLNSYDLGAIVKSASEYVQTFNEFNYGNRKGSINEKGELVSSGIDYSDVKYAGTFMHTIFSNAKNITKVLIEQKELFSKKLISTDLTAKQTEFLEFFNWTDGKFTGKFSWLKSNYIPRKTAIDSSGDTRKAFSGFEPKYEHLQNRTDTSNDVSDVLTAFSANLQSLKYFVSHNTEKASFGLLGQVTDRILADVNLKGDIKRSVENVNGYSNQIYRNILKHENPDYSVSKAVASTRQMISSITSLLAATTLAQSGVANRVAGEQALLSRFGLKGMSELKSDWQYALANPSTDEGQYAKYIETIGSQMLGTYKKQFIIDYDTSGGDKVTKYLNELSHKFTDVATKKFLFAFAEQNKTLTFAGAEAELHENKKRLVMQRTMGAVKAWKEKTGQSIFKNDRVNPDFDNFVKSKLYDEYMACRDDILDAIGNFDLHAKPYLFSSGVRYGDSIPAVAIGGLINIWSMFKQVSIHNAQLVGKITGKTVASIADGDFHAVPWAGVASTLLVSFYNFVKNYYNELPDIQVLSSINPAEDVVGASQVALEITARMFPQYGIPVNKKTAQDVEFFMTRHLGGMLLGSSILDYNKHYDREALALHNIGNAFVKSISAPVAVFDFFDADVKNYDQLRDNLQNLRAAGSYRSIPIVSALVTKQNDLVKIINNTMEAGYSFQKSFEFKDGEIRKNKYGYDQIYNDKSAARNEAVKIVKESFFQFLGVNIYTEKFPENLASKAELEIIRQQQRYHRQVMYSKPKRIYEFK